MAIYIIDYDLHEGEDYKDLIDTIKTIGKWCHCLDSTWLVASNSDAKQIRNYLRAHILDDDKIIVIRYSGEAAWFGFDKARNDWLAANL